MAAMMETRIADHDIFCHRHKREMNTYFLPRLCRNYSTCVLVSFHRAKHVHGVCACQAELIIGKGAPSQQCENEHDVLVARCTHCTVDLLLVLVPSLRGTVVKYWTSESQMVS